MKDILRKIYHDIAYIFFYYKFKKLSSSIGGDKLYIFDIDNTIADTWPTFNTGYKSTSERLNNINAFESMVNLISNLYIKNHKIIFLTARDYRYYFLTKKWLKSYNIFDDNLVMVLKPQQKIDLLKKISSETVYYYDDLSYNHENGEVKYYDDCIKKVKKLKNIQYIDYKKIKLMQKEIKSDT